MYPNDSELKVNVQTSQASYRPGEEAQVNLRVRAAQGGAAQSALGAVVLDRAVEERFRTDEEFGRRFYGYNNSPYFLGDNERLAGVTFRDLERLDMSKPVSPELDLLAAILLNQYRSSLHSFRIRNYSCHKRPGAPVKSYRSQCDTRGCSCAGGSSGDGRR